MSRRSARLRGEEPNTNEEEVSDPSQSHTETESSSSSSGSSSSSLQTSQSQYSQSQSLMEDADYAEVAEVVTVSDESEEEEFEDFGGDHLYHYDDLTDSEDDIVDLIQRQQVDDDIQLLYGGEMGSGELSPVDSDGSSAAESDEDAEESGNGNAIGEIYQNNNSPNENAEMMQDLNIFPYLPVVPALVPRNSVSAVEDFNNLNRNDDEGGEDDEDDHGENGPRPLKMARLDCSIKSDVDEDGCICTICYEKFTNSGGHRLCCLKCGHVFGKDCIERWIGSQKRCPQCNCKAVKKDIRIIYVKNLTAVDTTELDRAKEEVNNLKDQRNRVELSNSTLRTILAAKTFELERVQEENKELKLRQNDSFGKTVEPGTSKAASQGNQSSLSNFRMPKVNFAKHFDIKEGQCRVGAYNDWMNLLIVSHNISSPLYPGGSFGIKKINCLDFKAFQSFPIHQKALRDMEFSKDASYNDLLLTVGLDKKAVLFNCSSNCTVQTFNTPTPLWSCCWSTSNPTCVFYVGNVNGSVVSYDIRSPLNVLQSYSIPTTDRSPVVRMKFVPEAYQLQSSNISGLLVQKLNSVWFLEMANNDVKYHQLPLEGPFLNIDFEPESRHVLVSCRPKLNPRTGAGHLVCALGKTFSEAEQCNVFSCDVVQSITGGFQEASMICRSALFSPQKGQLYVAANGEGPKTVRVWDIANTEQKSLHRLNYEPALDFIHGKVNEENFLGVLTEKAVDVFKIE